MAGKKIGYIRVSSFDQNTDRQLEGIELDKVFIDKASGKDVQRPQLEALLNYVRDGDTIIIHSMDRLARNLVDLRNLVNQITTRDICINFVKENLIFTNENSPMATLMLSIMGAFAEFERSLLKERQREGIELAKKRGAYPGRKKVLNEEQIKVMRDRIKKGDKKAVLARELGISRETLYQYIRQYEDADEAI